VTGGSLILECVRSPGLIDPLLSVGLTIGLDAGPDAIDAARRGEGPPRVIVRPALGAV